MKRLQPAEAGVLLVPVACYTAVAAWVYVYFPRELVPLARSVYAAEVFLGGMFVASTVVANRFLEPDLERR